MERVTRRSKLCQAILNFMLGGLFSAALLLAGAETDSTGPWWPWVNLLGLFLFLLLVALANRLQPEL